MENVSRETMKSWAQEAGFDLSNTDRVENEPVGASDKYPEFVEYWVNKARSTEPIDQIETAKWIGRAYQVAGLEVPEIRYEKSPMSAADYLRSIGEDESFVTSASFKGNHESYWVGYYEVFAEWGLDSVAEIIPLMQIARYGGWVVMLDELAIMIERPSEMHFDEEWNLHNEEDMACKWSDGTGFYTWHGKSIEGWIITNPERITKSQVLNESDSDLRAIYAEQYGWDRLMEETGAVVMDKRTNPVEGTKEVLMRSDEFGTRLFYTCTTARLMSSGIKDGITTCQEAQEWLHGVDESVHEINIIGRT